MKKEKTMNKGEEKWLLLDKDKMTITLPQMNEVAQRASLGEGLPAGLIVCVTADGNREGPLA